MSRPGYGHPRYFYVGNFFSDPVKQQRNITTDSPAATGKVAHVCRAARKAGGNIWIMSLGRGRAKGTGRRYPAKTGRIFGVPTVYLSFYDVPVLTHLATMVSLFSLVLRITSRNSVLIYYNFTFHYLLALVASRLLGRRCILDIEDGFRADEKFVRSSANLLLLKTYNFFCNGGAMLASRGLREQTGAGASYVCYGVAVGYDCIKDWTVEPLQVLLGGSLLVDTGAELFIDTLRLLMNDSPDIVKRLRFVVTGFGDCAEKIQLLAQGEMNDFLQYYGRVSSFEYRTLMEQSHIGLCLKLPSSSMGATTFPSKVVELASNGLLVVSTKVSDVPILFDENSALLLDEPTPGVLASALQTIVNNPVRFREVALAGQKRITSTLAVEKVGGEVMRFWQGMLS